MPIFLSPAAATFCAGSVRQCQKQRIVWERLWHGHFFGRLLPSLHLVSRADAACMPHDAASIIYTDAFMSTPLTICLLLALSVKAKSTLSLLVQG